MIGPKHLLLPLLSSLFFFNATAQTFKKETLKADLNARSFDKILPYDEPFVIQGDVGKRKGVEVVQFSYALKDTDRKTVTLEKWKKGTDIASINPDSTTFTVNCGGIAPNREYTFTFKLFSSFAEEKKKAALKKLIAEKWVAFYDSSDGNYTNESLANFETDLNTTIWQQLKCDIYTITRDCCGKATVAEVAKNTSIFSFSKVQAQLFSFQSEIKDPINNLKNYENDRLPTLLTEFTRDEMTGYLKKILDTTKIVKSSIPQLQMKIDTDPRLKELTIAQFTRLLLELMDKSQAIAPANTNETRFPLIDKLLRGKGSFRDRFIYPADKHDMVFLQSLSTYFGEIVQFEFRSANDTAQKEFVRTLRRDLNHYMVEKLAKYYAALDKLDKFETTLPDLTADFFAATFVSFDDAVNIDMTSSSSPYISLDGGIGYNVGFKNVFSYYGVNFYFVPIKKRILLREYKDNTWLRVLKSTSLTVGIINNYYDDKKNSDRHVALLGNNKDLFVGIGNRFNRAMKLNIGSAFYYLKDKDPLSDKRSLQGKFVVTFSVDIDLIGAFAKIGTALNIFPQ